MSATAVGVEVFFSHNTIDRAIVAELTKDAQALGVRIYTYEDDPRPGEAIAAKLQSRIRQSDAVLALLTKEGATSSYVQQEIGFALNAGKLVVPLVEVGVAQSCLGMLAGIEYIPFERGDIESVRVALRQWLESFVAKAKDAARRVGNAATENSEAIALAVIAAALLLLIIYFSTNK